jgi:hypothetical protein
MSKDIVQINTEETYEFSLIDLKILKAKIKKEDGEFGRYFIEIHNEKFKNLNYRRAATVNILKNNIKIAMYYFMLNDNMMRYCKKCDKILIMDVRPFIDICDSCINKSDEQIENEKSELDKVIDSHIKTNNIKLDNKYKEQYLFEKLEY